jgi:uncharacterized protein YjdB
MKTNQIQTIKIILSFLVLSVLAINLGSAALVPGGQVGPIAPAGGPNAGFPNWYMDQNGLALELMEAADGFGISDPVDPTNPFSQQIGFNAEGFWWATEAEPANPHGNALLVLAMEAAFAGEAAVDGEQSAFGRIRINVDVGEPGTYTVTHPYGTETFVVDTIAGGPEILTTSDIGCFATAGILSCDPNNPAGNPNNFGLALSSDIGPFLTWDTFNLDPALSDPALVNAANPTARYIGNPNVEHAIAGSPTGNNLFRIEGPNIGGPGINVIETNLFTVVGRVAIVDTVPPVIGATTPTKVTQGASNVLFSVDVTDDFGVRAATIDLSSLGNSFETTLSGANEVPAIPLGSRTATGSGTFVIDTEANTLTFDIQYSGLTSVETVAHIHGPAGVGLNAPPVFDLPATLGTKTGTWNYPENLEADILAGNMYVNVHTQLFPNGEIRGQILPTQNVVNLVRTTPDPSTSGTWSVIFAGPIVRPGTFNLPIMTHDGSNVVNGNFVLEVVSPLASVSVDSVNVTIAEGNTVQLNALPLGQDGLAFVGATIAWTSSNETIATVDANGLVTGVAPLNPTTPGTATITATATFEGASVSGDSIVTVTPTPELTGLTISPATVFVVTGGNVQLVESPVDQFGFDFVGATTTWISSNETIATVGATGLVTGLLPGTVNITATTTDGIDSVTDISIVNVADLVGIEISPLDSSVTVGGVQQLNAIGRDEFGNSLEGVLVTWTSSNGTVATVDGNGLVTGVEIGSVNVTATSGALTFVSTVKVTTLSSASISPATSSITTGATVQLALNILDGDGLPFNGGEIVWVSSDPLIATIDSNGLVSAVSAGTATITANVTSGAENLTSTSIITVLVPTSGGGGGGGGSSSGGSSSGGSSSGGGSFTPQQQLPLPSDGNEDSSTTVPVESDADVETQTSSEERRTSGITGAVTGLFKNPRSFGFLIAGILILAVVAITVFVVRKSKTI